MTTKCINCGSEIELTDEDFELLHEFNLDMWCDKCLIIRQYEDEMEVAV